MSGNYSIGSKAQEAWKKYELLASLLIAIAIFLAIFYIQGVNFLIIILAAFVISIVSERMRRYFTRRNHEDERLVKITAFAALNSLIASAIILCVMSWLNTLHMLPEYSISALLTLAMFIMFIVFIAWLAYYSLIGDVE